MLIFALETIQEEDGGEGKNAFVPFNREMATSQSLYQNSCLTQSV